MSLRLATPEDTRAWGRSLAARLKSGDVVGLCGDLGAGKTLAVTGILEGLGGGAVTSPTFSLVQEHTGGRLPVWHFDFYRCESAAEILRIGWDEYLDEPGVVVVEWADRFPELFPVGTRWFRLKHEADGSRSVAEEGGAA
jgi:tRNA threonylcarbamoyladenosine biosynthesis protein TsaE